MTQLLYFLFPKEFEQLLNGKLYTFAILQNTNLHCLISDDI